MKPKGLSLFNSEHQNLIAQLPVIKAKGSVVPGCQLNCKVVADCNGSCRSYKPLTIMLLLLFFAITGFSQSNCKVIQDKDGNYIHKQNLVTNEDSYADYRGFKPSTALYKDQKMTNHRVWLNPKDNQPYYIIRSEKTGKWSAKKICFEK